MAAIPVNSTTVVGSSTLSEGSTLQVITITPALTSAPLFIVPSVSNVSSDANKLNISAVVVQQAATGFTVHLSGAPNSGNYVLHWTAYLTGTTPPDPPEPVPGSIALTKYTLLPHTYIGNSPQHVWPLKVLAVSNIVGLSSKIFVYHAHVPQDPYQGDTFRNVASVQQMTELPEDNPAVLEGRSIPFFRSDRLVFKCRSLQEAETLWEAVQADTLTLANNFKAAALVVPLETVNVG